MEEKKEKKCQDCGKPCDDDLCPTCETYYDTVGDAKLLAKFDTPL